MEDTAAMPVEQPAPAAEAAASSGAVELTVVPPTPVTLDAPRPSIAPTPASAQRATPRGSTSMHYQQHLSAAASAAVNPWQRALTLMQLGTSTHNTAGAGVATTPSLMSQHGSHHHSHHHFPAAPSASTSAAAAIAATSSAAVSSLSAGSTGPVTTLSAHPGLLDADELVARGFFDDDLDDGGRGAGRVQDSGASGGSREDVEDSEEEDEEGGDHHHHDHRSDDDDDDDEDDEERALAGRNNGSDAAGHSEHPSNGPAPAASTRHHHHRRRRRARRPRRKGFLRRDWRSQLVCGVGCFPQIAHTLTRARHWSFHVSAWVNIAALTLVGVICRAAAPNGLLLWREPLYHWFWAVAAMCAVMYATVLLQIGAEIGVARVLALSRAGSGRVAHWASSTASTVSLIVTAALAHTYWRNMLPELTAVAGTPAGASGAGTGDVFNITPTTAYELLGHAFTFLLIYAVLTVIQKVCVFTLLAHFDRTKYRKKAEKL